MKTFLLNLIALHLVTVFFSPYRRPLRIFALRIAGFDVVDLLLEHWQGLLSLVFLLFVAPGLRGLTTAVLGLDVWHLGLVIVGELAFFC